MSVDRNLSERGITTSMRRDDAVCNPNCPLAPLFQDLKGADSIEFGARMVIGRTRSLSYTEAQPDFFRLKCTQGREKPPCGTLIFSEEKQHGLPVQDLPNSFGLPNSR